MGWARILIAEDEPDCREIYRLILEPRYDLVMASNGAEAWYLIQSSDPDLLILDLGMPGFDGLTLIEKIKGEPKLAQIPIIVITGSTVGAELPDSFFGKVSGVDDFITKPFESSQIYAAIEKTFHAHFEWLRERKRKVPKEIEEEESNCDYGAGI
ncbi:MAG: response regulator [bacterium]